MREISLSCNSIFRYCLCNPFVNFIPDFLMNIFVGNLNPETVGPSLRTLFSEFGEVVSSKVILDNATGTSRGFGFVEMAENTAAQDAIDNLDMSFFEGNIISVKEAKQNTTPTRGGGNFGNKPAGGYGNRPAGGGTARPYKPNPQRPGGGYNNPNRNY